MSRLRPTHQPGSVNAVNVCSLQRAVAEEREVGSRKRGRRQRASAERCRRVASLHSDAFDLVGPVVVIADDLRSQLGARQARLAEKKSAFTRWPKIWSTWRLRFAAARRIWLVCADDPACEQARSVFHGCGSASALVVWFAFAE
jgi:hypothetical protein